MLPHALFSTLVLISLSLSTSTSGLQIPFIKRNVRAKRMLQTCDPDAICGTVQLTSRGLTAAPLCSCPEGECPNVWDAMDARSVSQGPIQYKHCRSSPPRRLSQCMPDQTAYTMKILTPLTEMIEGEEEAEEDEAGAGTRISHRIHCTCPDNFQHVQQGEKLERVPFLGEIKTYSLTCAPYPICGPDSVCKTLSETKTQFMENEVCRCPQGSHCPVSGNQRAKSFDFGVGRITQLFCQ